MWSQADYSHQEVTFGIYSLVKTPVALERIVQLTFKSISERQGTDA